MALLTHTLHHTLQAVAKFLKLTAVVMFCKYLKGINQGHVSAAVEFSAVHNTPLAFQNTTPAEGPFCGCLRVRTNYDHVNAAAVFHK